MKKWVILLGLLLSFYIGSNLIHNYSPIDTLEIQETNIELKPGETIQLTVKGYKYQNDGNSMKEVDISGLQIDWFTNSDGTDFNVDENGKLEALEVSFGNVQASYKDKIFSSPITVFVRGN